MTTDSTDLTSASLYFLLLVIYRELRQDEPDTDSLTELLELSGFCLQDLEDAGDKLVSVEQAIEEIQQ